MTPTWDRWDLGICLGMAVVVVSTITLYLLRAAFRGRAHHDRAESDGGSAVMGKSVVEFAYWLFEPLARGLHALGVAPDAVTLFSLLPGLTAGVAVAGGLFGLAMFLATVAGFCDAVDGLIARKRQVASDAGEALDAAVDRYMEFFFQAGLCFHYRHETGPLVLCLGTVLGAFMVSYTTAKAESLAIEAPRGAMRRAERAVYMLFGSGFTPLWNHYVARGQGSVWWRELPILLALGLMAVIGNVSVIQRTRVMMQRLRARDAAQ